MNTVMHDSDAPSAGPPLKPWMNRILLGAGIEPASKGSRQKRENWWGVEMMRFLKFCRDLPPGSSLDDCFRG
jgi:hypothetical protein